MTAAQDASIAQLEAELAAARDRIGTLESRLASQPSTGTVRITEVTPRIEQPSTAELARLYQIVTTKWPRLVHPQPERGLALFGGAIAYMASAVSHSDKRSMLSAGSWTDAAETWLRARHRPSDVSYGAIAAASVALGFGYSGFDQPAYSWNLWCSEGSHRLPGSAHWRGLLAGQPLRAPMPFDQPRRVTPERVVIRCGEGDGRPVETW